MKLECTTQEAGIIASLMEDGFAVVCRFHFGLRRPAIRWEISSNAHVTRLVAEHSELHIAAGAARGRFS